MSKSITSLMVIAMLSGFAIAQTPTTTATTATKKPAAASKTTTAAKTPAKKAAPAKAVEKPKVAEKPKPSPVKTAGSNDNKVKTVAMDSHRRDPFVNPLQLQEDKLKGTAACTTGARCLMIDQVVLKGVVKTQAGMIAMVENSAKKQYNLREKDPVYNGFVLKITGDTIVFKESTVDTLGKSSSREVVKRVTVPAV